MWIEVNPKHEFKIKLDLLLVIFYINIIKIMLYVKNQ